MYILPQKTRHLTSLILIFLFSIQPFYGQTFTDEGFSLTDISGSIPNDVVGFSPLPDGRILVIRRSGTVAILVDGTLSNAILTIPDVNSTANVEQGLLGIAVHPAFPDSNYVYLFYTRNDNANEVFRCQMFGDLSVPTSLNVSLDINTREKLVDFVNEAPYHQGGGLRFGIDGKLYISHGDDSRKHFIQDYRNYRGKVLRLNPNGSIPSDNPVFPNTTNDALGGIFAMGLRNPFRFAVDPLDGSLFIGDVGANLREELNIASGGENFGWPRYEGNFLSIDTARLQDPNPVSPILEYVHGSSNVSVIALSAYRPSNATINMDFPAAYDGALFYADYYGGPLYALMPDGSGGYTRKDFAQGFVRLIDATIAPDGSLLMLEYGKRIVQVAYTDTSATSIEGSIEEANLLKIFPNPLSTSAKIKFEVPAAAAGQTARLKIVNQSGQTVEVLLEKTMIAGPHELEWSDDVQGESLPAGLYFLQLECGEFKASEKFVKY